MFFPYEFDLRSGGLLFLIFEANRQKSRAFSRACLDDLRGFGHDLDGGPVDLDGLVQLFFFDGVVGDRQARLNILREGKVISVMEGQLPVCSGGSVVELPDVAGLEVARAEDQKDGFKGDEISVVVTNRGVSATVTCHADLHDGWTGAELVIVRSRTRGIDTARADPSCSFSS